MISALKVDPQATPTPSGKGVKDPSAPEIFDPMLASLVAQLLGSLQAQTPKAAESAPPPRAEAPERVEAPAPRGVQEAAAPPSGEAAPQRVEAKSPEAERTPPQGEAPPQEATQRAEVPTPATEAATPQTQGMVLPTVVAPEAPVARVEGAAKRPGEGPTAPLELDRAVGEAVQPAAPAAEPAPSAPAGLQHPQAGVIEGDQPVVDAPRPQPITHAPVQVEQPKWHRPEGTPSPEALANLPQADAAALAAPAPQAVQQAAAPAALADKAVLPAQSPVSQEPVLSTPAAAHAVVQEPPQSAASFAHPDGKPPSETFPTLKPVDPSIQGPNPAHITFQVPVKEIVTQSTAGAARADIKGVSGPTPLQAVGTTAASTAAKAPASPKLHPVFSQVEGTIRWILKNQEKGAELQLHPESLGKVQIRLTMDGHQVHAQVWASDPNTLPILQDHRAFLEVSLREQGLSLGQFELQYGQRGQNTSSSHMEQKHAGTFHASAASSGPQEPSASQTPLSFGTYRIEVFA